MKGCGWVKEYPKIFSANGRYFEFRSTNKNYVSILTFFFLIPCFDQGYYFYFDNVTGPVSFLLDKT